MKRVLAAILIVLVAMGGVLTAVSKGNNSKNLNVTKFYAGRPVEILTTKHGYSLLDSKTGNTILYVNYTAINENLDSGDVITRERAIEKASQLCGGEYTLVRVTENPYDFDLLFERRVNGISVFGESCYVSINKKTGNIGAYRRLPVKEIDFLPEVKIPKSEIIRMTGSVNAKLVLIPELGVYWFTTKPNSPFINAVSGEKMTEEEIKILEKSYRTTVNFKELGRDASADTSGDYVLLQGINNNQGAVFRDEQDIRKDDIDKAEAAMEKERPNNQPAWDSDATDKDIVYSENEVNIILYNYEAVYFAGHGNDDCLALGGDAQYCSNEVANNRQTRLFVISACNASNNLAPTLVNKGVQCVIGSSKEIYDTTFPLWWSECANWADIFWDKATGNVDAGSQRTAHTARVEANADTWFGICDLDSEDGDCDIKI